MLAFNSNGSMKKICGSCLDVKPVTEFYRNLSTKDGLQPVCKKCSIKAVRKWQAKNRELVRKNNQAWEKANKEWRRQQSKKWAQEHPARKLEIDRQWRKNHPEEVRERQRKNKDKIRIYSENRRARKAKNGGILTIEEWNEILEFYGHKCLCCGRDDVKLTIDHVLPIAQGGPNTADNVQPLCRSCNSRKNNKHIDYRKEKFHAPSRD